MGRKDGKIGESAEEALTRPMFIDTNIVILFLEGDTAAVRFMNFVAGMQGRVYISVVTVTELLAHPALRQKDIATIQQLIKTHFIVEAYDIKVAIQAAYLRRVYKIKLGDAVIAASALEKHMPLVTQDTDFNKVTELEIITIY